MCLFFVDKGCGHCRLPALQCIYLCKILIIPTTFRLGVLDAKVQSDGHSGHHPTPLCHAIIDLDLGTPLKTFSSALQNPVTAAFSPEISFNFLSRAYAYYRLCCAVFKELTYYL